MMQSSALSTGSKASRPKRVITEARKLQNREAQRAYRQRQKERLKAQKQGQPRPVSSGYQQLLPYLVGESVRETIDTTRVDSLAEAITSPEVSLVDGLSTTLSPSSGSLSTQGHWVRSELQTVDIDPLEGLENIDVLAPSSLLSHSSLSSIDDLLDTSIPLTTEENNTESPESFLSTDTSTTIYTQDPTFNQPDIDTNAVPLPNPYTNRLVPTRTSLLTACMYNAETIGISIEEFFTYNCMSLCSTFYQPTTTASTNPKSLLHAYNSTSIPTHLRPTLPQILIPHHPVFDLIPIPVLRSRAIILSNSVPGLVNMFDLKRDIIEGGLVCWGVADGEREKRGSGQPWDLRSWEVAPWFWKKWRLLFEKEGGGLW